jgi:hypothetical protein
MKNNLKKQIEGKIKRKKRILDDRTTVQIRKVTLKRMTRFKEQEFHPRATYDEMLNKILDKEIKKSKQIPK